MHVAHVIWISNVLSNPIKIREVQKENIRPRRLKYIQKKCEKILVKVGKYKSIGKNKYLKYLLSNFNIINQFFIVFIQNIDGFYKNFLNVSAFKSLLQIGNQLIADRNYEFD